MVGALSFKVNVMFFHLSFLIRTHSNLVERVYLAIQMDLDPVALASRTIAWWDSFSLPLTSLMKRDCTLGVCPEAGNKKKIECLQESCGRKMVSCPALLAKTTGSVLTLMKPLSFLFGLTAAKSWISSVITDVVTWKSTKRKISSIFKWILYKLAN